MAVNAVAHILEEKVHIAYFESIFGIGEIFYFIKLYLGYIYAAAVIFILGKHPVAVHIRAAAYRYIFRLIGCAVFTTGKLSAFSTYGSGEESVNVTAPPDAFAD